MIYRYTRGIVGTAFFIAIVARGSAALLWATLLWAQDSSGRTPIPDAEAQARAERLFREVYEEDCTKAKTSTEKAVLAEKMLDQAIAGQGDPADYFVLLREAKEMAAQAGHAEMAIQAVKRISEIYDVDGMAMKRKTLDAVSRSARTRGQFRAIIQQALPLANSAVVSDDFKSALHLCEMAANAARKAEDYQRAKQIIIGKKEVAEIGKEYARTQEARATLKQSPRDQSANLVVGRYYCLTKGDWNKGISMLALGSEGDLKALTIRELRGAASSVEWVSMGDGWWDLGQEESAGPTKDSYLARAAYWYSGALNALPEASEPTKTKVETRIGELNESALSKLKTQLSEPESAEDPETKEAVASGLRWLAGQQREDGNWNFSAGPHPGNLTECPGAATSMVLLPFLRAGHTHQDGIHQGVVSKGLTYVTRRMKQVGPNTQSLIEPGARMYGHALATIAFCEAYERTGSRNLRVQAQSAVSFIIYAQDPKGGGWRYEPRQAGDTSVTGWQVSALQIAADAGLRVPPATTVLVHRFLNSVQTDEGAYYGYNSPGQSEVTTAIGLLCRTYLRGEKDNPALERGVQRIVQTGASQNNLYYNYYATQLMRRRGGESWKNWRPAIRGMLLASQTKEGEEAGSWYVRHQWADSGGALYCTAMAIMTLQICEQ